MSAPMDEVPAGSAMVYMPFQTGSKICNRYKHKQSIGLGITQIIIGILCSIFNSICIGLSDYPGNDVDVVGHGCWCGILFSITGIFGVIAGKKKTRCQIVAFMVLCIISAAFTIVLIIFGSIGALTAQNYIHECQSYSRPNGDSDNSYSYFYRKPPCNVSNYEAIVVMESLLAICGLVEAIVAILGSTLCCRSGICCSSPMMVLSSAGYLPLTEEMISNSQTQGGQYVYSPQPSFSHDQGTTAPPAYVQPGWAMPTTNIGDRSSAWPSSSSVYGQPGTKPLDDSTFNKQQRFLGCSGSFNGSGSKSDQVKC